MPAAKALTQTAQPEAWVCLLHFVLATVAIDCSQHTSPAQYPPNQIVFPLHSPQQNVVEKITLYLGNFTVRQIYCQNPWDNTFFTDRAARCRMQSKAAKHTSREARNSGCAKKLLRASRTALSTFALLSISAFRACRASALAAAGAARS